jgi:hypothetical protein
MDQKHRLATNDTQNGRPRFWRYVALGTIAQGVWLARRRGLLQRQIEERSSTREHHDVRLTGLPTYPEALPERTGDRPTVSVVVPALNEADSIGWVLENIPSWVTEVVLVDGLSIDRTEVVARTMVPNLVVVHQRDKGKGAALRAGFYASRCDIVAMIDADGSTDPRELGRFVDALVAGADFVKGSREMEGGGSVDFTPIRRLGNLAFVLLCNIMYGTRFTDLLYGYCAFWRDGLDDLELSADGFEIETQLVVNAVKAGMTVAEVPSIELERRAGASNLHAFSDGLRILETMMIEHPQIGQPTPGETFEMVEIERAAHDVPEWLPAGSDRRTGGDRRNAGLAPDATRYIGTERRVGADRRAALAATVKVLVPRRGPDRRQTRTEDSDYVGVERRNGRDRRTDALYAEARSLAQSIGTDTEASRPAEPRSLRSARG